MGKYIKFHRLVQNIPDKKNSMFYQSDIEEFYSSITKHLMSKATEHAEISTSITQQRLDIILHARKSLFSFKDKL